MKQLFLLLLLLQIASCRWISGAGMPHFAWTDIRIPDGTPAFQKGYKVGCAAVLYARGNVYYRTKYDYEYDPKMIGNPEYRFGYSRGWSWCFNSAGVPGVKSFDATYIAPYDPTFGPDNLNKSFLTADTGSMGFSNSLTGDKTGFMGGGFEDTFSPFHGGPGGSIFGGFSGGGNAYGAGNNVLWGNDPQVKFMGIW